MRIICIIAQCNKVSYDERFFEALHTKRKSVPRTKRALFNIACSRRTRAPFTLKTKLKLERVHFYAIQMKITGLISSFHYK